MVLSDRIVGALSRAAERARRRAAAQVHTSREDLVEWARAHLSGLPLIVVSNREPWSNVHSDGAIRWIRNAGGLTVALDSVVQALGGVWVAHGSGDADREVSDSAGRVPCPPDHPSYTLHRVWLSEEDHALYYAGAANSALWPLCHNAYVRPRFRPEDWERYRDVNRRFAEAVIEEAAGRPAFVFLQDYHLALAARFIKEQRPDLEVVLFWHIPWPNPEVFRIFPWQDELLDGLLANDLVGFHVRSHALNFLNTVAGRFEARVDLEQLAVERRGRRTWVRTFPIGVPASEIEAIASSPEMLEAERALRVSLNLEGIRVGLGVDRLDYTKGIPERLEALECLYERHPEWIGRFAFVQIGVPSRIELDEYRSIQQRTREITERINRRFPRDGGPAVHLIEDNLDFRQLVPFYRMADLCAVTALHDGMNLVAKEYLAASPDLRGALVLSPFTGAARELERAFLASPYDREGTAEAYHAALSESEDAQRERMAALRETVLRWNIYDWALDLMDTAQCLTLSTPTCFAPATGGGNSIRR